MLFLISRGLPLWQIEILEGIFHTTSFLFEVPSGALADLLSRKRVMILGRVLYTLSAVLPLTAKGFWMFAFAFIINALSYNLNSGSEEALVYDGMKLNSEEADYLRVNSRLNVIAEAASGIATLAGGILAQQSYTLCYGTIVGIGILSILPLLFMTEPNFRQKHAPQTLRSHAKCCIAILRENPRLIRILLYYPTAAAFGAVVFHYGQEFYANMGLNRIQISIVMLLSGIASCLGALMSEQTLLLLKDKTKYAASLVMALGIFITACGNLPLSIAGFCLVSSSVALLYPIESAALNTETPSAQRATILSVDSMCFSIAMICFFPAFGAAASLLALKTALLILGGLQTILLFILLRSKYTV